MRIFKSILIFYLIFFFTFGWTAPIYAQEATGAAQFIEKEASKSAQLLQEVINPQIPKLKLPFDGEYPISLQFGEAYPSDIQEKLHQEKHDGIDFETPENTAILAVDDGEVVLSGEGDFGITVKISHEWGTSVYGHLHETKVVKDQKVTKGQQIALSGSSGESTGPHLHFGIKPKNPILSHMFGFIDPTPYLLPTSLAKTGEEATSSSTLQNNVAGVATASATLNATSSASLLPKVENIATDSAYLFNYKFELNKGTSAHFYDKDTKTPSFAIADKNYDYKLRFFLNNGNLDQPPKVEGNTVEFPVAIGGIPMTLRYKVDQNSIKEEFIVQNKPTQEILDSLGEKLEIPFTLSQVGLQVEQRNGEYVFISKDGTIVWRILAPTLEDSQGKKGAAGDVDLNIEGSQAVLSVKSSFLKDAVYPLVIDPTWTQTDWSGGSGQTSWSDTTKFDSSSNMTTSSAGQFTLAATGNWYNASWQYRKKITLANTTANLGVTATTLTNFPVLVKLTSSNFDFSKAQSAGQDIRFTDSDGTTLLSYEIEKWDSVNSQAWVWVKKPSIDTTGNDNIYFYYGNSSAADAQAATSVWNSNYVAVFHLKESGNGTAGEYKDSTSNAYNGQGGSGTASKVPTLTASGQLDGAQTFDGGNDVIRTTAGTGMSVSAGTISAWAYPTSTGTNRYVYSSSGPSNNRFYIQYTGAGGTVNFTRGNPSGAVTSTIPLNQWSHLVLAWDATTVYGYVNGLSVGSNAYTNSSATAGTARIGSQDESITGFPGIIDEMRISNVVRPESWIAATYKSDTDAFGTFASEEPQVQTSGTLTSSIFDSGYSSTVWGTLSYTVTTPSNTTVSIKVRASNNSDMSGATDFSSCTAISSGTDISSNSCVGDQHRYIQYQASLANTDSISTPTFQDLSITYDTNPDTAPSSFSGATAGTDRITWSWTDNATNESGFYVQDTSGNTKCTVSSASSGTGGSVSCTETGLSPDTSYTRNVVAYNSLGNSPASSNASATTRILPAPSLNSPADLTYTSNTRPLFKFQTPTDNSSTKTYSDVASYKLTIKDSIGTYITVSDIPTSRTTDYDGGTFIAQYEGFSDSDITNNYITIYTKSSPSWSATSNDGNLKEGKNTWFVASVDSSGNESAASRIIYEDFTLPIITDLSSANKLGAKDGFLILTNILPTITGIITDNVALDHIELQFWKESYFLGNVTETALELSQNYTLISSDNSTNFNMALAASEYLSLGSFKVYVTVYDKAGNKSQSTLKIKIMTTRQAEELLTGKISEEEKSNSTISLTELEKKARLRREMESAELEKFITSITELFGNIISFLSNSQFIASLDENILKIMADAQIMMQQIGGEMLALAYNISNQGIALGSTLNHTIAQIPVLGQVALQIAHNISEANKIAIERLSNSERKLLSRIAKDQQDTNQYITKGINSLAQFSSSFASKSDEILTGSQDKVKERIAQAHQSSSDKLVKIGEGFKLALKATEQPIQNTADFMNRVKIGVSTFQSIVFDDSSTKIANVTIEEIGQDYAVVSWETNHYATGKVNYGNSLSYGEEVVLDKREKYHQARLTGLAPGQRIFFEVMSEGKNYTYDAYYSFETLTK